MVENQKIKHLIVGPCSAETREQVMDTASQLVGLNDITMFRAGIWKPRTNPNSFEGIGKEGLPWLQEVRERFGFKIITEVATTKHVEDCLAIGIDAVWIGARTTVNPFYVQELANALQGTNIPVYIKNPISPDIGLWFGGIERLKNAGIKDIIAIHRGFYNHNKSVYRNTPMWELPVKLKATYPDIDVICDPSHITGNSFLIEEVSTLAFMHDMDGLMIETHRAPKDAWSDSEQQITPNQLKLIMDRLKFNKPLGNIVDEEIDMLRSEIDSVDQELLDVLASRFEVVRKAAKLKKDKQAAYFQLDRWKAVLEEAKKKSSRLQLKEEFIEEIMNLIHKESLSIHNQIYLKD